MWAERRNTLPVLLAAILLLGGCGSVADEPVDFYPEDMCSLCKMAISDKRFAGELITSEGTVLKFDDLGCMLRQLKKDPSARDQARGFVIDFENRGWIPMREAHYARSDRIQTPMRSGIVAFRDATRAEAAAAKNAGRVLDYTELESTQ